MLFDDQNEFRYYSNESGDPLLFAKRIHLSLLSSGNFCNPYNHCIICNPENNIHLNKEMDDKFSEFSMRVNSLWTLETNIGSFSHPLHAEKRNAHTY